MIEEKEIKIEKIANLVADWWTDRLKESPHMDKINLPQEFVEKISGTQPDKLLQLMKLNEYIDKQNEARGFTAQQKHKFRDELYKIVKKELTEVGFIGLDSNVDGTGIHLSLACYYAGLYHGEYNAFPKVVKMFVTPDKIDVDINDKQDVVYDVGEDKTFMDFANNYRVSVEMKEKQISK